MSVANMLPQLMPSSENAVPSSTPNAAVFSDEPACASSPPSSPPGFPWDQQQKINDVAKSVQISTNNAFSMLGKRKALGPASGNARPSKTRATASDTIRRPASSKALTQMQLSLGQKVQTKCKTCGMEYVPSSAEDRKLHDKYHRQNTHGYDIGRDFVQKTERKHFVHPGIATDDSICVVDCHDKPARRRRGQGVLEVVQRELGAVEIPQQEIWDFKIADEGARFDPKYVAYLYVREAKCVGFLLVQKIMEAYKVEEPAVAQKELRIERSAEVDCNKENIRTATTSLAALKARQQVAAAKLEYISKQPLTLSQTIQPARLGICRIWTSATHRGQDIGIKLLDTAFEHHNLIAAMEQTGAKKRAEERHTVSSEMSDILERFHGPARESLTSKEDVAFSQPTEAGTRLARRWYGKMFGWKVYVD